MLTPRVWRLIESGVDVLITYWITQDPSGQAQPLTEGQRFLIHERLRRTVRLEIGDWFIELRDSFTNGYESRLMYYYRPGRDTSDGRDQLPIGAISMPPHPLKPCPLAFEDLCPVGRSRFRCGRLAIFCRHVRRCAQCQQVIENCRARDLLSIALQALPSTAESPAVQAQRVAVDIVQQRAFELDPGLVAHHLRRSETAEPRSVEPVLIHPLPLVLVNILVDRLFDPLRLRRRQDRR